MMASVVAYNLVWCKIISSNSLVMNNLKIPMGGLFLVTVSLNFGFSVRLFSSILDSLGTIQLSLALRNHFIRTSISFDKSTSCCSVSESDSGIEK